MASSSGRASCVLGAIGPLLGGDDVFEGGDLCWLASNIDGESTGDQVVVPEEVTEAVREVGDHVEVAGVGTPG